MLSIRMRLMTAALLAVLVGGCSPAGEDGQTAGDLPEGHPPVSGGSASGGSAARSQGPGGIVLETMDGGGYTYVRLGADGEEIWVAGPVTALQVGDTVQLVNAMAMGEFTSKALDRTFENLYFADAFNTPGDVQAAAGGGSRGVVRETMNSGGYTYVRAATGDAEVWIAGPQTVVAKGDTVAWSGGMVMRGFTSKTLDRSFDEILFVNQLEVVAGG